MSTELAASRQRPNPPRAAITCAALARRDRSSRPSPALRQPGTTPHCRAALAICSHLYCVHVNPQRISSQLPEEKSQNKRMGTKLYTIGGEKKEKNMGASSWKYSPISDNVSSFRVLSIFLVTLSSSAKYNMCKAPIAIISRAA